MQDPSLNKYYPKSAPSSEWADKHADQRKELQNDGYSFLEVSSIQKNGYVMPNVFADALPSDAYLKHAADAEAHKISGRPPADREAAQMNNARQRAQLSKTLQERGDLSSTQIESILTYGYHLPAEYSATPAKDQYDQRLAQRDSETPLAA